MEENHEVNQEEEEPDEVVFDLGDGSISQSELDRLLSSEDPKDKERLKSIIIVAATNDNYGVTIYLLSQGYQLEVVNDKNQTITHLVFYSNTRTNVFWNTGLAFSNRENLTNYVDDNGLSLLHIACATGYIDVVKQFLNNGEDINGCLTAACDRLRSGFTPLHFAVAHHEMEIVELLLERGADINAVDSFSCTPLLLACAISSIFSQSTDSERLTETTRWNSELNILKLLLELESDLCARDSEGNTPILRTFRNYCYQRLYSDKVVVSAADSLAKPKLALLLHKRQLEKFLILFQNGADVTAKNYNDENILHCIIGVLKSTRQCISAKFTVLNYDEMYGGMIQLLLEKMKELDINAKNKQGETPIALAVSLISCKIVQVLLDFGAHLNSIHIDSPKFFKYPNVMPTVDVVINLKSLIALLVEKGFNLTLDVDLAIMKYLTHDVDDCDCGKNVSHVELWAFTIFYLASHSDPSHLKRVFMNLYGSLNGQMKSIVLMFFRIFLEYSKSIPYSVSMDEEIQQIVYEETSPIMDIQSTMEKYIEGIVEMKSTKLKCGVDVYDLLTKYSHKANIFKLFDADDVAVIMEEPLRGIMVGGYVKKSIVRAYIESAAYENYIGLLIPFLPDLCRKMILEYLDNEDILKLCSAALLE